MFCMNCGTQLPDSAKFCLNCGTAVNIAEEQPVVKPETQMVKKSLSGNAELESNLKDAWALSKEILKVDYLLQDLKLKLEFYRELELKKERGLDTWFTIYPEEYSIYQNPFSAVFKVDKRYFSTYGLNIKDDNRLSEVIADYSYLIDLTVDASNKTRRFNSGDLSIYMDLIKRIANIDPEIVKSAYSTLDKSQQSRVSLVYNSGEKAFWDGFYHLKYGLFASEDKVKKVQQDYFEKYGLILFDDFNSPKEAYTFAKVSAFGMFIKRIYDEIYKNFYSIRKKLSCEHIKECDDDISQLQYLRERLVSVLDVVYSKGYINSKYQHNYIANGMLYDYIASQRCYELEGPNGAYNLYENELRMNYIIENQEIIITKLAELGNVMHSVTRQLSDIRNERRRIHTAANAVEHNTRMAAMKTDIENVCEEVSGRY